MNVYEELQAAEVEHRNIARAVIDCGTAPAPDQQRLTRLMKYEDQSAQKLRLLRARLQRETIRGGW